MVLLTVLTIGLVLILVGVLVVSLLLIIGELERIGGDPDSVLAKIRWGVRAIERQTAGLEPEVGRLNHGLRQVDAALTDIAAHLAGTLRELRRQGGSR